MQFLNDSLSMLDTGEGSLRDVPVAAIFTADRR